MIGDGAAFPPGYAVVSHFFRTGRGRDVAGLADAPFAPAALRAARQRAGLSQGQLAAILGVSDANRISLWERGLEQPSPPVVPRLAAALGIEPTELYLPGANGPGLAVLRRAAGLSTAELARRTGISPIRCQRIENGRAPTADEVQRLADALNVAVSALRRSLAAPRT